MSKKGQLHQLLASEGDLEKKAQKIIEESFVTFTKREHLFNGSVKTYEPYNEDDIEVIPTERVEVSTTVTEKLLYTFESIIQYWDAVLQKERTNQEARADVVIDGKVLLKDVPATFLLGMEKRLAKLRMLFNEIPTLPPGTQWVLDQEQGNGIYKTALPEVRQRTKAEIKAVVLYEATKEHPAQVEKVSTNVPVGKYTDYKWSGAITPAQKSQYLDRIDTLIVEVKKARQRANSTEVVPCKAGDQIKKYIMTGEI